MMERIEARLSAFGDVSDGINSVFAPASPPPAVDRRMLHGDFIGTTFHRYSVLRLLAETPNGMVFHGESLSHKSSGAQGL